jgi:hypothetical protein
MTMTYDFGNPGPGFGQAQNVAGVKPVNLGIPNPHSYNTCGILVVTNNDMDCRIVAFIIIVLFSNLLKNKIG